MIFLTSLLEYPSLSSWVRMAVSLRPWLRILAALYGTVPPLETPLLPTFRPVSPVRLPRFAAASALAFSAVRLAFSCLAAHWLLLRSSRSAARALLTCCWRSLS